MFSKFRILPLCLAAIILLAASPSSARDADAVFFESVAGVWKGPGEIVAGKYKGTKFVCNLTGDPKGKCRGHSWTEPLPGRRLQPENVGRHHPQGQGLHRPLSRRIGRQPGSTSSRARSAGDRAVMGINRKTLNGAMIARLNDPKP
jgi:hypothetical protein